MPETPTDAPRPPTHGLSDRDDVFFRDTMSFLAIAFVIVALVVMLAVRH